MGESTISIKVADGSFFPVLEPGFTGRKKLTLTTVKDNQTKVQIDLFTGGDAGVGETRYIGSLMIENIPAAPQGEPEIELLVGLDAEGQLEAEASDKQTGESQRFSTSVTKLPEEDILGAPDFEVEESATPDVDFEEPPLTGETYVEGEGAPRAAPARARRKGVNVLLLAVFVLLGLLLVGAAAYFIWRATEGASTTASVVATQPAAPAPKAAATTPAPAAPASETPAAAPAAPAATQTAPAPKPAATETTSAKPAATTTKPSTSLTYLIKRGDTLWDLAGTYYRNPWLYPRLARANGIKNPDLIFAGTRIRIPQN